MQWYTEEVIRDRHRWDWFRTARLYPRPWFTNVSCELVAVLVDPVNNNNNNNNNNIFLPSQLAYSKNYLIKQITNMYLEL